VPAETVADSTSARVVVRIVLVTDAPEPAADTPTPPVADATLIPTPKAKEAICCFDSARTVTLPPASAVATSIAARTEFVTVTTLRAAPIVTPTAAALPSVMPRPAPPALESIDDVSVAVTVMARSVVTQASSVITASVSTATKFVLPAPAPARPTAVASAFAT
jgi:hypothetical protein